MNLPWSILAFVVAFAAGAAAGEWDGARRVDLRWTAQTAQQRADLIGEWQEQVLDEIERADAIDRAGAQRNAVFTKHLQETQHALKAATDGRPCLGGTALRVLDQSTGLHSPAGAAYPGALPGGAARSAADPAHSGAAEGDDYASDSDVAGWIALAGDYYERCRERVRDIRRYDGGGD